MGRYFVGLLLPPDFANLVDELRSQLDPQLVAKCLPHITVLAQFEAEDGSDLLGEVCRIINGFSQCHLRLLGLNVFWGPPDVLRLRVEQTVRPGDSSIEELHNRFLAAVGGREGWKYVPHITLAELSCRQFDQAFPSFAHAVAHLYLDFYFTCQKLALFKKLSNGKWEVVQRSRS